VPVQLPVRHHTDELGITQRREGGAEIQNTDIDQAGSTVIKWPVGRCSQTGQKPGACVMDSNSDQVNVDPARMTGRNQLVERLAQCSGRAVIRQIAMGMLAADLQRGNAVHLSQGDRRGADCRNLQEGTPLSSEGGSNPAAPSTYRIPSNRCGGEQPDAMMRPAWREVRAPM